MVKRGESTEEVVAGEVGREGGGDAAREVDEAGDGDGGQEIGANLKDANC